MRPKPRYPVDRYLVESSKIEMVNIIDDDIWSSEPALRPEEEIILRKLHEMLQSTADDLKLLSGELARREPGMRERVRAPPAPLDDDFNEKIHIEEVVNAKFHGYNIIDKPPPKLKETINKNDKNALNNNILQNAPINNKVVKSKQLTKSRTRIVQINATDSTKLEKEDVIKKPIKETVTYNEFTFEYPMAEEKNILKDLQIQAMPSVDIRGELKEQKVLQLDIQPEPVNIENKSEPKPNVGVISMQHEIASLKVPARVMNIPRTFVTSNFPTKYPSRKVTKMESCESSTSTNNVSSDPKLNLHLTGKHTKSSTIASIRSDRNKKRCTTAKAKSPKPAHLNLDEWKKKLNSVYGQPSSSKKNKLEPKSKDTSKKISHKNSNIKQLSIPKPPPIFLNNTQYIPYSQLTLGGVNVSDIEREISNVPNKANIPLSPILDRITKSQENSRDNSPRKKDSPKILTTSDENLLREVIDIEKTIKKTISKNTDIRIKDVTTPKVSGGSANEDTDQADSYADDFEDEKSAKSDKRTHGSQSDSDTKSSDQANTSGAIDNTDEDRMETPKSKTSINNATFSKVPKLSFKKCVDIYEFVHEIDTEDTAAQSQTTKKISLKETQTSPRNYSPNIAVQPVHNNLWPSMDPSKDIEKMFKLEKELIKKLIIDEYGDLIKSSIDKPSTSKEKQDMLNAGLNVNAAQKVTQTSPEHAKSVMTSPTRTKTRTTSPFPLSLPVNQQTSPIILVTNDKDVKVEVEQEPEDLGISINLSSPRFSLRLPNTSLEVLSNLEICSRSARERKRENSKRMTKPVNQTVTSSTSIDADNSSSEISSLGEVKLKLKKKLRRRISSSESSSSLSSILSVDFNSVGILPLRSEGELSSIHMPRSVNAPSKSEGEISFGKR